MNNLYQSNVWIRLHRRDEFRKRMSSFIDMFKRHSSSSTTETIEQYDEKNGNSTNLET